MAHQYTTAQRYRQWLLQWEMRESHPGPPANPELYERVVNLLRDHVNIEAREAEYVAIFNEIRRPGGVTPTRPAAEWLGRGRVRVGEETYTLEDQEAAALEALVELRAATKSGLIRKSGVPDAVKVLNKLRRKYESLQTHIILPGGRGRGGYRTDIVDGSRPPQ